jgi:hypothetical protein
MRLKIILGSVLVVAILAAGCGGGDSSGGTGAGATGSTATGATTEGSSAESGGNSKPLSKKAFIARGDAICAKVPAAYGEKLQEIEKENPKASVAEKNLKAAVPPLYPAAEELAGLTPPKGDEEKAEAIVAALEAAAKGMEEKPTSKLAGAKSPFNEFQELTSAYGFKGCPQL